MIKARAIEFHELSAGNKILVWFTEESSIFDYNKESFKNDWIEVVNNIDPHFCCPPERESLTNVYTVVDVDLENRIVNCEEDCLSEAGYISSNNENIEWVLIEDLG